MTATTFHLAICQECEATIPFYDEQERDKYADRHETFGHHVDRETEVRNIVLPSGESPS